MDLEAMRRGVCVKRWIAEARLGSRAALGDLFQMCRPYLFTAAKRELGAVLRRRVCPSADLVQDTLLEACQDFPAFHGETEKDLLAWLRQILLHNLANEYRRHVRTAMRSIHREMSPSAVASNRLREMAQSEWESPVAEAQEQDMNERVTQALQQLPEHYRQALLLRVWEGLTFAQVGERLHCSAEAARKLWGRAAEELARLLRDVPEVQEKSGR